MNNEFEPSFKTRLINKIDEHERLDLPQGFGIDYGVRVHAELEHDDQRIRREVEDVIERIKSDDFEIESADEMRDLLDGWDPADLVYTADIEEAVSRAGISECFGYVADRFGGEVHGLNDLYSAVHWDLRDSIISAFVELAELVEEESGEE